MEDVACTIKHYRLEMHSLCSNLMCLWTPVEVTDNSKSYKTLADNKICPFTVQYKYEMFFRTGPWIFYPFEAEGI